MTREKKPRVIVFSFQRELTGILHLHDKAKIRIRQGGILDKGIFHGLIAYTFFWIIICLASCNFKALPI
jgi:hypothetical protein